MSELRPAPNGLGPARVDRLLEAMDHADDVRILRALGLSDAEIARLAAHGRDIGTGPLIAAREIVRCSLAVMEGNFS